MSDGRKLKRVKVYERFCDFCPCLRCQTGDSWLTHAQTEGGRWICDVCYNNNVSCTLTQENPCVGEDGKPVHCVHRPKLITDWMS